MRYSILGTTCVLLALSMLSCTVSSEADCTADADCASDQRCVSAGGLFARDGVCVDRNLEDDDPDESQDNGDDPADCATFRPRAFTTQQPATVTTLFEVRDCETGDPRPDLDDISIAEDGDELDNPGDRLRDWTERGHRNYVTLLVDMSDTAYAERHTVVAALNDFVDQLLEDRQDTDTYVGIEIFDGSETVTTWQPPLDDPTRLEERIDAIVGEFSPADNGETNLYGALYESLGRLQQRLQSVRNIHENGVVSSGHLVVFSATGDSMNFRSADNTADAVHGASIFSRGAPLFPLVDTRAVALEGEASDELAELVGADALYESDLSRLDETFRRVADRIAAATDSTRLVTHCSAMRSDDHTLTLEASDPDITSEPLSIDFSAADFEDGCDSGFLDGTCEETPCGGLYCGGCDDRTEVCRSDGSSTECIDYCRSTDQCLDGVVENALGYRQQCQLEEAWTTCDAQCVDVRTNTRHCGMCDNDCPDGVACQDGTCECDGDRIGCFGQCIDPTSHDKHCGACNAGCEVRCSSSECITAAKVAAGVDHSCAILENQTVECWGLNDFGQLGNGETGGVESRPVPVENLDQTDRIFPGFRHTCALSADGSLQCWGSNSNAQLGDATTDDSATPVAVDDQNIDGEIRDVVLGERHSCARTDGDALYCWGDNDQQQLGVNDIYSETVPPQHVDAFAGGDVLDVAAGAEHTCAVVDPADDSVETNRLYCWGQNNNGQVGHDDADQNHLPHHVESIGDPAEVSAGTAHSCARTTGGDVYCWGRPDLGRLGVDEDFSGLIEPTPYHLEELPEATALFSATRSNCAIDTDDDYHCWGRSEDGQLGTDGQTLEVPALVAEFSDYQRLSLDGDHACGVTDDGIVDCRGANADHQLGDGTDQSRSWFDPVVWH